MTNSYVFRRFVSLTFIFGFVVLAGCASTPGREEPLAMVVSSVYSPDGKLIAVSTSEGEIGLFDAQPLWFRKQLSRASDKVPQPRGYAEMISAVYRPLPLAFSPDGGLLAASSVAGNVVVWDVATAMENFRVPAKWQILDVVFLADGQRLVLAGSDAVVLSARNGEQLASLALPSGAKAGAAAVSPDGRSIIVGLSTGQLAVFDSTSYALTEHFKGHEVAVTGIAFAPDGSLLASTAGGYDLRLWKRSAAGRFEKAELPFAAAASASESVSQAQGWGTLLWLLGTVRGFQLAGAPTLGAPPNISATDALFAKAARTNPFHCGSQVSFSADGRYLASTANLMSCADCIGTLAPAFLMFVTDLKSGATTTVRDTGCAVSLAPDGNTVATGGPGAPMLRESSTGRRLPK